jgi:hypothetical protein
MADEDILAQAASTTQSMLPIQKGNLTSFGPAPMVQPPPIPRMASTQPSTVNQGEFTTKGGRQRADRQALFSNLANLVKNGGDYIQAKKQRNLTMVIERLMGAQEGLKEAQAANDQEGIKRNSAILNDITSDPKIVKQLQKAFNIDLFGNGKNKNENMALSEAWKNYQKEKQTNPNALNPTAQRLQQAQPMRQQLSPEAQAQAMAIQAGLVPKAGEVLKAYQENFKTLMTAKDNESRNEAIENAAKIRAKAEEYHADKLVDAATTRVAGAQATAEIVARSRRYVANSVAATWDKRLKMMDSWTKMKTGDSPIFKKLTTEAKTYNDTLKSLAADNEKLQAELDKKGSSFLGFKMSAAKGADANIMRSKIASNNAQIQLIMTNLNSVTKKMQTLDTMGVINMEELSKTHGPSDSGGDEGNSQDKPINAEDGTDGE